MRCSVTETIADTCGVDYRSNTQLGASCSSYLHQSTFCSRSLPEFALLDFGPGNYHVMHFIGTISETHWLLITSTILTRPGSDRLDTQILRSEINTIFY